MQIRAVLFNESMKKKNQKLRIILTVIALVIVSAVSGFFIYVNDDYKADGTALAVMRDSEVHIQKAGNAMIFEPNEAYDTGIIFYPGGKVETEAYAPLMERYAKAGYYTVLVEMPFELAILGRNRAEQYLDHEGIETWYIGGHSLGGACAAMFADSHRDEIAGLILLGAYSTKDLSDSSLSVLSLYGSQDQIMNREKYEENRRNLPENTTEEVLIGGNHSQFGSYGLQKGDGYANITAELQWDETVDYTKMMTEKDMD